MKPKTFKECNTLAEEIEFIKDTLKNTPNRFTTTYVLPELTDEELQKNIDENGLTGQITPQEVRDYMNQKIYESYCKAFESQKGEKI